MADSTTRRLALRPVELTLANGNLRIANLYKLQAAVLADTAAQTAHERIDRMVAEVFTPYAAFWQGYLGNEAAFREWAPALLEPGHAIHATLPYLAAVNLDSIFEATTAWLQRETGREPHGRWYLVYGPGWTNMGGLGDIGMVADFSRQDVQAGRLASDLSHELAHQVHGARQVDADRGTVLERIVSEGLASYANWVFHDGGVTPARSLGYTEAEWTWALAHEEELAAAARRIVGSRSRDDLDRVAARNQRLVPRGPSAAGYFLGFRIAEAYVQRNGPRSWHDLLSMPVRQALLMSGYRL